VSTVVVARPQARWATVLRRIGVVLAVLQAVLAFVQILGDFSTDPVALTVNLLGLAAAAVVLIGAVPAWLGRGWGVVLCVVGVMVMALSGLPVYFIPGVPAEAIIAVSIGIVVGIATTVLLVVRPRRG
jgi:hypothetical protein